MLVMPVKLVKQDVLWGALDATLMPVNMIFVMFVLLQQIVSAEMLVLLVRLVV
jgi:hypothetical protein